MDGGNDPELIDLAGFLSAVALPVCLGDFGVTQITDQEFTVIASAIMASPRINNLGRKIPAASLESALRQIEALPRHLIKV